jgi:hypothetical protein
LVFTTAQRRESDGSYILAACVANLGGQAASAIEIAFSVDDPRASITSLRAPSAPGEVSSHQARAIVGKLPPGFQTQLEIAVRSRGDLDPADVQIRVPLAYRLTSTDPALRCWAEGISELAPELTKAQFTVGGEPIDVRVAANALRDSGVAGFMRPASNPAFLAERTSVSLPAAGLSVALITSAAFILGLGLLALLARRR